MVNLNFVSAFVRRFDISAKIQNNRFDRILLGRRENGKATQIGRYPLERKATPNGWAASMKGDPGEGKINATEDSTPAIGTHILSVCLL